jgi:hypothetical protein
LATFFLAKQEESTPASKAETQAHSAEIEIKTESATLGRPAAIHIPSAPTAYRNSHKFFVDRSKSPQNGPTPPDLIDNLPGRTINTG